MARRWGNRRGGGFKEGEKSFRSASQKKINDGSGPERGIKGNKRRFSS